MIVLVCSGAPDCTALNRDPCTTVPNTCGPCFRRHLTTPGEEGFSNIACYGECCYHKMPYSSSSLFNNNRSLHWWYHELWWDRCWLWRLTLPSMQLESGSSNNYSSWNMDSLASNWIYVLCRHAVPVMTVAWTLCVWVSTGILQGWTSPSMCLTTILVVSW